LSIFDLLRIGKPVPLRTAISQYKQKSWSRFAQMKWNILKHFQYSLTYVYITRTVHINCGSAIATLPGTNWATPLGKLKTTTFFMPAQRTRVVQHDADKGGGELGPHTMQNETV